MEILTAPDSGLHIRMCFAQSRDINVQTVMYINPASVNDVEPIAALAFYRMRIDIEEICARDGSVMGLGGGCSIGMESVVHMCCDVFKRR